MKRQRCKKFFTLFQQKLDKNQVWHLQTQWRIHMYKAQSDQITQKIGKIDSHLLRRCIVESEWWNSWQSPHHSWYSWHWKFVSIYISLSIHFSHQYILKVSEIQNEFMMSFFLPKCQPKILRISALEVY